MLAAESAARCGDGTAGSGSHRPTIGVNHASETRWFIPVVIGMEMVEMLVDTGSGVSSLSREVHDSMGARRPKLKGLSTNLTMANGSLMEADGKARFSMSIAGQRHRASMVVGELKGVKGILGMDFLMRNRADMDLAKGVLHLHGRAVPMHKEASTSCCRIRVAETVEIPPGSEMFVKATITGDWEGEAEGLVEPLT